MFQLCLGRNLTQKIRIKKPLKKEQLKVDARQKRQEEKTKKSINFQREHRPLYSEGHIPIGKREAVVEKSSEKKKKILIELE